jgi:hypothetical protein
MWKNRTNRLLFLQLCLASVFLHFACNLSFERVSKVATLPTLRATPREIELRGALVDVSPGDTIVEYGFLLAIDKDPTALEPDTVLKVAQGAFTEPRVFSTRFPVAALMNLKEKAILTRAYAVKSSGEILLGGAERYVLSFGFVNNVNLTPTSLSFDIVLFFGDSCIANVLELFGSPYGVLLGSRREVTLLNALDKREFVIGDDALVACISGSALEKQVSFNNLKPGTLYFLRFYWVGLSGVPHYGEPHPVVTPKQ